MLIEFTVGNYLSIKEPITLSMVATKDTSLPDNIIYREQNSFLKSSVLYGANASGKSNIFKSLRFMQHFVINSHKNQKGDETGVIPFKLDKETFNKPSVFNIIFINEGIKYAYGFALDSKKVVEEYLYSYPYGRKKTIFERGINIPFYFTSDKIRQNSIIKETLDNTLYLSKATQSNYKPVFSAFDWFRNLLKLVISDIETPIPRFIGYTGYQIINNPKTKKRVLDFLREADIGISNIDASLVDFQENDKLNKDKNDEKYIEVRTTHIANIKKGGKYDVTFELREESNGTIKCFGIIGPWIDVLDNGYILIYDELDTILHPLLTRFLVTLFNDLDTNPKNAQLIFNTHDANLLDNEIFRRDQIWFTEKRNDGSTDLYPLTDYRPRKEENLKKNYLLGRYGAIPIIGGGLLFGQEGE